jgi:hypothetical protein
MFRMRAPASRLVFAMLALILVPVPANVANASQVDAAATDPPISPARLQALARYVLEGPHGPSLIRPLSERVAVPLGLTSPGTPYEVEQLGFEEGAARHAIAVHVSGTGKLLFMYIEDGNALLWVCDMNGNLLTAGQMIGGVFSLITLPHARATFEAELRQWSQIPLPGDPVP